jgi:ribosome recycling factor
MSLDNAYKQFEEARLEAIEWLKGELRGLRTGRVKPDLVDSVMVEHYGSTMPLKGVANVANSDARTLVISPWDPSALAAIKKAITVANIGVQPIEDGKVVRLSFPSLTEELREQTIKMAHKKAEEARIRLRRGRDESLSLIKKEKTDEQLTEDDFYEGREKLDKLIDKANDDIAAVITAKEAEIKTI